MPSIRYLSGFTGSNAALLVTPRRAVFLTDGRYRGQAKQEVRAANIRVVRKPLLAAAGEVITGLGRRARVAFSPEHLSIAQMDLLRKSAGPGFRGLAAAHLVEELREVKDEGEVGAIQEAGRLISLVLAEVTGLIRPGLRELDLAAEIEYRLRRKGAEGPSFETIVASGPRTAWPHARPTGKCIQKNDLVVLDAGAILRGYCSDLTRTVYVGRAPGKLKRWYRAVWEAQDAAIAALRAGQPAGVPDAAARSVLKRYGLERRFTHSLGHGLGLEVHEQPRLARGEKRLLGAGSVVTIEPGVYVEGVGGIRIEDDLLIGAGGSRMLTSGAPRNLIEL